MMRIDKTYRAAIERVMAEAGVEDYSVEPGGKHPHLRFSHRGTNHRYTLPASPSDHRGAMNMESDLRALVGLTQARSEAKSRNSQPVADGLPSPDVLAEIGGKVAASPPSAMTSKDEQALSLLSGKGFVSAITVGREARAANPDRWGVERLERLRVLGKVEGDGSGRYRRL